jgi:transposase-like protein
MQGWRTLAEVARELGITDRTLRLRLKEAGIHPARPGRNAMLSDQDVTKLMEQSRSRRDLPSAAPQQAPSADTPQQRARNRQDLLAEVVNLRRLIDKNC